MITIALDFLVFSPRRQILREHSDLGVRIYALHGLLLYGSFRCYRKCESRFSASSPGAVKSVSILLLVAIVFRCFDKTMLEA